MILKMKKFFITVILLGVVGIMGINWISLPSLADTAVCKSGTCSCACAGTDCICSSSHGGCFCDCAVGNYKKCDAPAIQ